MNIRCPYCGRVKKKSHDKRVEKGKPYHPKCETHKQYIDKHPKKEWKDYSK